MCAELCPTLCDSMDGSLLGSSVRGISQARILEWVAFSSSRNNLIVTSLFTALIYFCKLLEVIFPGWRIYLLGGGAVIMVFFYFIVFIYKELYCFF